MLISAARVRRTRAWWHASRPTDRELERGAHAPVHRSEQALPHPTSRYAREKLAAGPHMAPLHCNACYGVVDTQYVLTDCNHVYCALLPVISHPWGQRRHACAQNPIHASGHDLYACRRGFRRGSRRTTGVAGVDDAKQILRADDSTCPRCDNILTNRYSQTRSPCAGGRLRHTCTRRVCTFVGMSTPCSATSGVSSCTTA